MVLPLLVALLLCALAIWVIAKAALNLTARLGVDPMALLLWLGLAERPSDDPAVLRARLGDLG